MYSRSDFRVVIGMEFHVQASSQTKLFSRASMSFGEEMNQNVSEVDAGMPGALPCVNKYCVESSIKMGLALNMHINNICSFDRKHYSYPDLPLKYQITQFYQPIAENGYLDVLGKRVRLDRISLEADAGKNVHLGDHTYVDLNRCGSPLMEVVTAPDMSSEEEAAELFRQIRSIARYIGVSDANMDKGQLRADVNVSINLKDKSEYGTRVEIKNLNSITFTQQALSYEIERHIACINAGKPIKMETRTFDPATKQTISMRDKETNEDYRYIPDPDLLPIHIPQETIDNLKATLPELPGQIVSRWMQDYGLTNYEASLLSEEKETYSFFESCLSSLEKPSLAKQASSWILGDFSALLNKAGKSLEESLIKPSMIAELVNCVDQQVISGKQAKDVFKEMFETGATAKEIIAKNGLSQISDPAKLTEIAQEVISKHPKEVEQVQSGKLNIFGFLVGQALKISKGQANPESLNKILKELLGIG